VRHTKDRFSLADGDPPQVLYVTLEALRHVAIMYQPIIPGSASRLLDLLAVPSTERTFAHLGEAFALKPGTLLPKPTPVFPRIEAPKDEAAG
jgi:methionyl-tRNA synthetase